MKVILELNSNFGMKMTVEGRLTYTALLGMLREATLQVEHGYAKAITAEDPKLEAQP